MKIFLFFDCCLILKKYLKSNSKMIFYNYLRFMMAVCLCNNSSCFSIYLNDKYKKRALSVELL